MRHQGRRNRQKQKKTRKSRMTGFLQPCFLLQLHSADSHGYDLLQGLQDFMTGAEDYDPSIIYRIMRDMERNGWVTSYEGAVSRGPKRRMYSLTEEGERQLVSWVDDLKKTRDEIDNLLNLYNKQVI